MFFFAEFIFKQAELQNITLPVLREEDLRPWLMEKKAGSPAKVEEGGNWFAFDFCNKFLQTESSVSAAVADLLERLHRWNVDYAEVRFCPELHTEAGILTSEEAVEAVLKGKWKSHGNPGASLLPPSPLVSQLLAIFFLRRAYTHKYLICFMTTRNVEFSVIFSRTSSPNSRLPLPVCRQGRDHHLRPPFQVGRALARDGETGREVPCEARQ